VARNASFNSSSEVSIPVVTPEDLPTAKDSLPFEDLPLEDPGMSVIVESNPGSILLLAFGLLKLGWPPKVVTETTLEAVAKAFILEGIVTAPGEYGNKGREEDCLPNDVGVEHSSSDRVVHTGLLTSLQNSSSTRLHWFSCTVRHRCS